MAETSRRLLPRVGLLLFLLLPLWLLPLPQLVGQAWAAELWTVGRAAQNARFVELDPQGRLVFEADDAQRRELPAGHLVRWGNPLPLEAAALVLSVDGSLLVVEPGEIIQADEDRLEVQSLAYGGLTFALSQTAGLIFELPAEANARWQLIDRLLDRKATRDRAWLANGDLLSGVLRKLNGRSMAFEAEIGPVDVLRRDVVALAMNPQLTTAPPQAEQTRVWVGLEDGSRLLATGLVGEEGRLAISRGSGLRISVRPERVVWLQAAGGLATYLSDLEPAAYRHVPYLDTPWPFARDRNLDGGPLACGGRLYAKGLAMHSAARLSYAIPEGMSRFRARAGLDDAAAPQGSVQFRVYVDSEPRYTSPVVRRGDPPLEIDVEVVGGRLLSLLVGFADRGDVGDRADWLDARFEPAQP